MLAEGAADGSSRERYGARMERRHRLLAAMAVAAGIGAAGAAALVAGDDAGRVAAGAVTVTVARTETAIEVAATSATTGAAVAVVPPLTGVRLDDATALLQEAHLRREVKGGGVFGVLDDSAWVVCKSKPREGEVVARDSVVSVQVKRSCPGGNGQGQGPGAG
jgi:hypothetical protein